jgi:hypothetical protein
MDKKENSGQLLCRGRRIKKITEEKTSKAWFISGHDLREGYFV